MRLIDMDYNNYLAHHGVKGMKWGIRKNRYNANYTTEQRSRDRSVYGRGGVRRINRSMNRGTPISGARSKEADRIYNARKVARVAGLVTGAALIGVVAYKNRDLGMKVGSAIIRHTGSKTLAAAGIGVSSFAAVNVANQLGRYGGESIAMLMQGYSPTKRR